LKKLKLIYIEWFDAETQDDWTDISKLDFNLKKVKSVGWLINENDNSLTILPSHSEDDQCMGALTIPKGWIKKRRNLKEPSFLSLLGM